jgi:hypothetical protein
MMIDFKNNWNKSRGKEYMQTLKDALEYIENYKDRVIKNELGKHPQSL